MAAALLALLVADALAASPAAAEGRAAPTTSPSVGSPAAARAPAVGAVVHVELSQKTSERLNPRLVRRLLALEVRDLDVPPPPDLGEQHHSLFFRVFWSKKNDAFQLELWEHGRYHGARLVRSSQGSPLLDARRLALSASALVRRLRWRRGHELRQAERRRRDEAEAKAREAAMAGSTRLALGLGARFDGLSDGAFLAGPEVDGQLRFGSGGRLQLGLRWVHGVITQAPQGSPGSALELRLLPGYGARWGRHWGWFAGIGVAAGTIDLRRVDAVDDIRGATATWTSSALATFGVETRLARHWWLAAAPEVGMVLRPVRYSDGGASRELGGLRFGLALSGVFDPGLR